MSIQPAIAHPPGPDPVQLLDELKRVAVEQLGAVPGGLYGPIEEQLQEARRLGSSLNNRNDLMTVLALRQRGSVYVMRYRELIARSFDDFRGRSYGGRPELPLGLVGEGDLDFHLAGQHLAESIGRRYQRPLEMLDGRFEAFAAALGLASGSNPVGATRLAGAFLQTFHDADISESLRPLLFRQYEQELAKVLGELYGRLNGKLAASGFHVEAARAESASSASPSPPPSAPASERAMQAAPGAGIDLFRISAEARVQHQQLRDQIHQWRNGWLAPAPLPEDQVPDRRFGERRELRTEELTSVASLLQRDVYEPFEQALAGKRPLHDVIREELLEGARRLGIDPDRTMLGEREEDAIDLVGLLFSALLETHALAGRGRRLFARLVMSYVRIAMTDENLFVRPDHPGRRLIDALALSCESNDGATPQDRELLDHASRAVERVVAEYNEDLAIFELAANELHDLLQQQRRRAEIVERRSAETVHGRERLLQARLQAASLLAQRISARALTGTVRQFLEQPWQHHLVQILLRDGQGSPRSEQALALADALIGVDESAALGRGGAVADQVFALRDALVACLSSSGFDDQVATEWMAELARTLAFPDAPRQSHPLPAMPKLADDSDDTRLLAVVGGTDALQFDPAVAERMGRLEIGDWMRLIDEGDAEGSVKVAWISPLTSRLLLVNRRGVRKLVASAAQLAALAANGRLFVDADDLPFDEAMRQVRQRVSEHTRAA